MKIKEVKDLKVAILIRNFDESIGGAERYCVELTRKLAQILEVHVFCQRAQSEVANINIHIVKNSFVKPRFLNQLSFSFSTKQAVKNYNFDIVHSHDIVSHANIYTIHVPCFKGGLSKSKGLIFYLKNLGVLLSPRKLTYLFLEKKTYDINNLIISVSDLLSKNIQTNYPQSWLPIIAPPGITPNFCQTKIRDKPNGEIFSLLFVANGFLRKGLDVLIKSLELLNDRNIKLVVIGNGNPREINFTNACVEKNVTFIGKLDNIDKFYRSADLLVHPTKGDTFGMVVLEAMSFSLPVIVSNENHCGISSYLSSSNSIVLNNHNNINELADNIKRLKDDTKLREKISKNAFNFATSFTWDNTLKLTLEAYNNFLKGKF